MLFGVALFYVDARKLYSLWVVQFIYKESLQKSKESMHCKHAISGLFRDECENTNLDGQRQARHECKLIGKAQCAYGVCFCSELLVCGSAKESKRRSKRDWKHAICGWFREQCAKINLPHFVNQKKSVEETRQMRQRHEFRCTEHERRTF